jgi:hypothetical protein
MAYAWPGHPPPASPTTPSARCTRSMPHFRRRCSRTSGRGSRTGRTLDGAVRSSRRGRRSPSPTSSCSRTRVSSGSSRQAGPPLVARVVRPAAGRRRLPCVGDDQRRRRPWQRARGLARGQGLRGCAAQGVDGRRRACGRAKGTRSRNREGLSDTLTLCTFQTAVGVESRPCRPRWPCGMRMAVCDASSRSHPAICSSSRRRSRAPVRPSS